MNFHTLTPDIKIYVMAILVTWCLGSSSIASHFYSRWFANSNIQALFIQCVVKALICVAASFIIPVSTLFDAPVWVFVASVPVGLMGGKLAVDIELLINRYTQRRKTFSRVSANSIYFSYNGAKGKIVSLAPTLARSKTNLKKLHEHGAANEKIIRNYNLVTLLVIAILEEIIFRGVLLQCCLLLPVSIAGGAMVMTVICFGASHAGFGIYQMISKTLLGALCLMAALTCHTVLPAIIIHCYLNWAAYRKMQEKVVIAGGSQNASVIANAPFNKVVK